MAHKKLALASLCTALFSANIAYAENVITFYTGIQESPHSTVKYNDPSTGTSGEISAGWEGNSSEMPPYYGIRLTHWYDQDWGVSLDFTHSKAYANDKTLNEYDLKTLEFTDGVNTLTVNGLRRFQSDSVWTPYVGAGVGIAVPHVEFEKDQAGAAKTYEYQFAGFGVQAQAGVDYKINDTWSVFGEYKFNYTDIDVDLKGGGSLQTELINNALNIGINYKL